MDAALTIGTLFALFLALVILAAVPSVSTLTVAARSAAFGLRHGVMTTLGILTADVVFILSAIYGLAALAANMDTWFVVVKLLGGGYLIGSGIVLLRTASLPQAAASSGGDTLRASYLTGLSITFADQKAILFYLGFFPAFMDLKAMTLTDTVMVLIAATIAVGGVKLAYARLADQVRTRLNAGLQQSINSFAGGVMIAVGAMVLIRS
jgi:threonine/homoserine/homoserine lactone efflux protein